MKRYVNFMSNPDERTAIDQFGTGDKCFGVAVMMSTLPGLPMFGHGQIEGFTEKYGMEYQRPRYDETPNHWLVERHEREVAPLLKKRWLFAESSNFLLYDFFEASGSVNENVYAYSNRSGNERALVVYNNRYASAHGTVDYSAAYADKGAGQLRQRRLREGLDVTSDSNIVLMWCDSLTGLEYLRRANVLAERGLTLDLHAYQCHVFLNWRELRPTAEQPWDRLCDHLNGRGVPNLEDALILLELEPVHAALRALLDPELVRQLACLAEQPPLTVSAERKTAHERNEFVETAWTRFEALFRSTQDAPRSLTGFVHHGVDMEQLGSGFRECLRSAMQAPKLEALFSAPWPVAARRVLPSLSPSETATALWSPVFAWSAIDCMASSIDRRNPHRAALELFDRLRLREPFARAFQALGVEGEEAWRAAARIKVLLLTRATPHPAKAETAWTSAETTALPDGPLVADSQHITRTVREPFAASLWQDPDVRWLTGVHTSAGHDYLVKEPFEELVWWLQLPALIKLAGAPHPDRSGAAAIATTVEDAVAAVAAAEYKADRLLAFDRRHRNSDGRAKATKEAEINRREKLSESLTEGPLEPVGSKHD
jgi:hypothetical protein